MSINQIQQQPLFTPQINIDTIIKFLEKIKTEKDARTKAKMKRLLKNLFNNDIDYEIFRMFPLNEKTGIDKINNEYIIMKYAVVLPNPRYRKYTYEKQRICIIGIDNSTNKLFINLLNSPIVDRSSLGFDYHYHEVKDVLPSILDNGNVSVRVQGDLIFTISRSVDVHVNAIKNVVYNELSLLYNRRLSESIRSMIQTFLLSNRLSHNIRTSVTPDSIYISVSIEFSYIKNHEKYQTTMENLLTKFIKDNIVMDSIQSVSISCNSFKVGYFNKFCEIVCSIDMYMNRQFIYSVLDIDSIVKKLLQNPSKNTLMYGNHIIEWIGVPHRFTVTSRYNGYTYTSEITLYPSGDPLIIPVVGSEVVVRHSEHGEEVIKIERPVAIIPRSVNTSQHETLIRNRIVLEKLSKNA